MSLADIVRKIENDAAAEATAIVRTAEVEAGEARAEAARASESLRERTLAQARVTAEDDASMRVAAARLSGRDRLLAEKRVMIERVLKQAMARLVALPDEEYAALLAREIAKVARGSEDIALGESDAERLRAHLPAALREAGCSAQVGDSTTQIDRGVLLEGDRMRVEVSIAALVHARQEEHETVIAQTLFGEEG